MKLERKQPNGLKDITVALAALEGYESKVGWFENNKYPDGTQVAYVAQIQEFGAGPIPPRPFMRPTAVKQKAKWLQIMSEGAKAVLHGKLTAKQVFERVGLQSSADIAKTIASITSPPLSPITIELRAMKKKNPGLKITGKLVGEVAAKVREPGYTPPTGVSTKPLNDTGVMLATLHNVTERV
ncbi:MAG: hypothetical protein KGL39_23605 [Patescibacteria group bacterium]|nr:hypothetical protein [Patescibacteria group bacterium]